MVVTLIIVETLVGDEKYREEINDLELDGISHTSLQGDKAIIDILKECGVNIDERLVIYDKQGLWHFIPDLLSKYQAIPSGYEFKKFSSTGKYVALVNKSTNQVKLLKLVKYSLEFLGNIVKRLLKTLKSLSTPLS